MTPGLAALLALLCAVPPADEPPPRVRQEIVVTADRQSTPRDDLTSAASVIDAPAIAATPSLTVADLFAITPGIVVFGADTTSPATIAVRGFYGGGEVEYVQLRIDGVPVGDVESGLAQWQQFRVEEVERVEIARGMESALYGDTAMGGVVQLFTRRETGNNWSASAGRGSFDSDDVAAALWHGAATVLADGSTTDGDRPHSSARRSALRVLWRPIVGRSHLFTLAAERRQSDRDEPGPLPLGQIGQRISDPLYRRDDDHAVRQHLGATLESAGWLTSVHAAWKSGNGIRTILLFPPALADSSNRTIASHEVGASVQVSHAMWRAGADAADESFHSRYFDAGAGPLIAETSARRTVFAAYATTQRLPLGTHAALVAGLRADAIHNRGATDRAWSPRVALHAAGAGFAAYLGASSGFKAPTLEQLYDVRPLRAFGRTFMLANPTLVPQRARSLEGGVSHRGRIGLWQLDAYLMRVAHEIDFDPRTFHYGNISRSEHRGVEAAFEPDLRSTLTPRLTYTWMRVFSLDDPAHAQLKNIPEHSASAMITAHLPLATDAAALFAWNGRRWLDDAESIAAPDTRALSLRLQHAFGPATVRFDVRNATGAHNAALGFVLTTLRGQPFAYAVPDARRSVRLSLVWSHSPR
jgi:vitamin B12 transporter